MNEEKKAGGGGAVETGTKPKSKAAPDAIAEEGEGGVSGGKGTSFKKRFENAIRKNKIIATIQQLGEEKDVAGDESQLERAGRSIRSFRDRFQKSRPNSMCDKADMVPVDGNGGGGVASAAATSTDASAAAANGEKGEGAAKG